jgi:hypothetical protein
MSAKTHLEAAAAYIAVAESGDAKREAYVKAADEILAAQADDPELTQAEVARRLGKGKDWVSRLLMWHQGDRSGATPFARDPENDFRARSEAKKVPTRHEDRVEMATKLLADPEVVKAAAKTVLDPSTKAGRLLSQAAYDQDSEKRRHQRELEEQSRARRALPLPASMAKMVVKMNEWSLGLAGLIDELDSLPEGRQRELVADAARSLAVQAQRWVDRLEGKPDLRVIEGQAVRETVAS